ncbi:MAG: peptidylprolyl isomerase [Candidatus Dactylopiibacterium carminicum]|uniref:peptidylprolyl isomerase n=1 Tax=Candidatus Dactylopiibacterium carminicum TaxID=857335 RepID=A0A272EUQ7_9RHOO|nr:peptidyl-prolyl cis-trans isomerase [Candidatus Dactylopiibacterium carminicum]KAF7600333.1 peptidylprolyl isomerase [Candidatus Dactylopiibacterium carminicum]PAS93839.1 MAG: peptidylprolyl isomerase [Candidatus Dactylopiibacterium carminicum]PAS95632.1 MAG: peptidylprolyl isomerase [Candidatus Dactylopiibacterium carminicum]PAT00336.1 MAG: peptidylprolyl isomerase [Candidatus Dactylopiibacterium carminicum]
MKTKLSHLAIALVLAATGGHAAAQATKPAATAAATAPKAVAKVNGTTITADVAELMIQEQLSQGAPNNEELRQAVRNELIQREVLAQEARRLGFEKRNNVAARLTLTRQGVLVGGYIDDWMRKNPISDAALQAEYGRLSAAMAPNEYQVRHIQTEKEDAARTIIQKLQSGSRFEDLAKESIDEGSRDKGGEIGWISPRGVPEAFAKAIESLEKGKFTPTPVQTPFGFHVIKLEDVRKSTPPKFEEVREEIRSRLSQQQLNKHIQELVAKAKVE